MKIYLAACFEQQEEVRQKLNEMESLGFTCMSSWRFEDGLIPPTPEHLDKCASRDLADLEGSDWFVCLTDKASNRGGKHVELGYALALRMPVILVGRRENIFHSLRRINWVETWPEAVALLLKWQDETKRVREAV